MRADNRQRELLTNLKEFGRLPRAPGLFCFLTRKHVYAIVFGNAGLADAVNQIFTLDWENIAHRRKRGADSRKQHRDIIRLATLSSW